MKCRMIVSLFLILALALSTNSCRTAPSGVRESTLDLDPLNKNAPPKDEERRKKQLERFRTMQKR